jgi:hypothetical protein
MHARIEVGRRVRNLGGARIARSNQAVNKLRCRVAEDLLRVRSRHGLREVVILHRDHKNVAGGGWPRHQGGRLRRRRALQPSEASAALATSRRECRWYLVLWS